MSLIDKTYFIGGYKLPNLDGVGGVTTAATENLNWHIAKYEPAYLRLVLGETLYTAFIAGLAITPTIPARWVALRNILVDSTNDLSYIAAYVYFFIERKQLSFSTSQGQAKAKAQNADLVTNTLPVRTAYNDSMDYGLTVREWLVTNLATYPEYTTSELEELNHLVPW